MAWIKNAPQYGVDSKEDVCKYIDQCISHSSTVSSDDQNYLLMQHHEHSCTCVKKNQGIKVCRFGAPWPSMSKIKILEPLNTESEIANKKQYSETFADIQQFLKYVPVEKQSLLFDEFLKELKISEEEYLSALQSSMNKPKGFLKRQMCDIRVNSYMKG